MSILTDGDFGHLHNLEVNGENVTLQKEVFESCSETIRYKTEENGQDFLSTRNRSVENPMKA